MSKLTVKQEKFAQKYVELGNASEAYRLVYDCKNASNGSIYVQSSNALKNSKVSIRVKELQGDLKERHNVTVDSITLELEEARAQALIDKQSSAAVSASMGKAKLHGLADDKVKHEGNVQVTLQKIVHSARIDS